ncbi:FMN-dependent NADH-azoreductase [Leeuwenhoekiella sp. A16]|uniref:FMN-dependent NADH-azoreductase n=1 Tax=unclassified Leeuwenhoekiella TaxID=2615029 RepID=UPI003A8061D6
MKKILNIISSPRGADSFSSKLSTVVLDEIKSTYGEVDIKTIDLSQSPYPHLDETLLTSLGVQADDRSEEMQAAVDTSDKAVSDLKDADIVIIGVPMYNFSIPSTLKSWIDHIARAGISFRYTEAGVEGLIKDKKVYLCIATGGVYSAGPMQEFDFTEPYMRKVLAFLGMTDVTTYRVEGVSIPDLQGTALEKAIENIAIEA